MAGPPTSGYARALFVFSGDDVPLGAATSIGLEAPPTGFDDAIAQSVLDAYVDNMLGLSTAGVTLDELRLKVGPEASGPTIVIASGDSGEQAAAAAPPNVSNLVRLGVENVSNRFGGRMFVPGVNEGQVDGAGLWSSAYLSDGQLKVNGFLSDLVLQAGCAPVVFSSTGAPPRLVTTGTLDPRVATQRRRLRR